MNRSITYKRLRNILLNLHLTWSNGDHRSNQSNRRIMFVLGFNLPFPGAGWRRIEYFSMYLARKGFSVYILGSITPSHILTLLKKQMRIRNGDQNKRKAYFVLNVQPYVESNHVLAKILNMITGLILIFTSLVLKPAVIIVSIPNVEQVLSSYVASRLVGAKLIVDIRDPHEDYIIKSSKDLTRIFAKFLKKLNFAIYRRAEAVTTVTEGLVNYLAQQGVKALLVPNGADVTVFRPYPNRDGIREKFGLSNANVIVFNGYLGDYYNLDALFESLAELIKEDRSLVNKLKLMIIGDILKQYRETFVRRIKELDIKKQIVFLGIIRDQIALAQLLSACDVGLIPRVEDPFFDFSIPAKFYEYIACGLPVFVLARKGSELWNVVERYKIGYTCQPNDVGCIKQVLNDIVEGSNLKELKARVLMLREFFSREASAKRLYGIVKQLLTSERR